MKEAFKRDMRFLYPAGLGSDEYHQFRDLIRVFSMGWCDALMAHNLTDAVEQWTKEFRPIAEAGWFPDDSWKWW
jgi:hypothetical protein